MSNREKTVRTQRELDGVTQKLRLYVFLLLLFIIPTYAARGYEPRLAPDLVALVLADPLINGIPWLLPVAKLIPLLLIAGLFVNGERFGRLFIGYVALFYVAVALFQNSAFTDGFGFVLLSGNMALMLFVALLWFWELRARRMSFLPRRRPLWQWWVAPVAVLALLFPVDTATMTPDFSPLRLLTNEAGVTFCMMTPIFLAVLTLFFPLVNRAVLRVTSFAGILLGLVNLLVWFVLEPTSWWMGVLHLPLLSVSLYAFVLSQLDPLRATELVTPATGR